MITVRMFFSKTGDARYLSHLDLMRCFQRAIARTGLNVWFTQGFNTHMYIMFSCPLSLGYESTCESVDFRLINDEDISLDIAGMVNKGLPNGVKVFSVIQPVMKHTEIEYSQWNIIFRTETPDEAIDIKNALGDFFSKDEIIVIHKGKKGESSENAVPFIKKVAYEADGCSCILTAVLKQNTDRALNPKVLLKAFSNAYGIETEFCEITRTAIFDGNLRDYK